MEFHREPTDLVAVRRRLILDLEASVSGLRLAATPLAVSMVEGNLREQLRLELLNGCRTYHPDASVDLAEHITIDGRTYDVRVQEDLLDSGVLDLAFVQLGTPGDLRRPPLTANLQFGGRSRYREAQLYVPRSLQGLNRDRVCELAETILATGTAWLESYLEKQITSSATEFVEDLYRLLAACIAHEELLNDLWLSVGTQGHCHFLSAPSIARASLELATQHGTNPTLTPMQALAQFLAADVPFHKSHGEAAGLAGRCIDRALAKSEYNDEIPFLSKAQQMIWQGDSISVYCLYFDGEMYLAADFPTRKKEAVLPLLEAHQDDFVQVFLRSRKKLRAISSSLRRALPSDANYAPLGEFVAGVVRGLAN